jgi:hypothetical protein
LILNLRFQAILETRWPEYLIRFALGGFATAIAGLISKVCGPEWGGLFLAFPAIFSASATLTEQHERNRKEELGLSGQRRGQSAAALDAAGAALGSVALAVFGIEVWKGLGQLQATALLIGGMIWVLLSILLWEVRQFWPLKPAHYKGKRKIIPK